MKLRNKKTGEIDDYEFVTPKGTIRLTNGKSPVEDIWVFDSLAELFKYFEEYKPAEPLIKGSGVREVLRLWAKVNLIPSNAAAIEYQLADTLKGTFTEFWYDSLHIMFYGNIAPDAVHGKIYTLDELCGEEE